MPKCEREISSLLKLRDYIIEARENNNFSDEVLQGLEDLEKIIVRETKEELHRRRGVKQSQTQGASVAEDLADLEDLVEKLDRELFDISRRLDIMEA